MSSHPVRLAADNFGCSGGVWERAARLESGDLVIELYTPNGSITSQYRGFMITKGWFPSISFHEKEIEWLAQFLGVEGDHYYVHVTQRKMRMETISNWSRITLTSKGIVKSISVIDTAKTRKLLRKFMFRTEYIEWRNTDSFELHTALFTLEVRYEEQNLLFRALGEDMRALRCYLVQSGQMREANRSLVRFYQKALLIALPYLVY